MIINLDENYIFIDKEKKYLKGNLHTHSIYSDGKYNIQELISIYEKNGYDFLGITDHEKFYRENIESDLVLLHGIEISNNYIGNDKFRGAYTHFCCFSKQNERNNVVMEYRNADELQYNMNVIREDYGVVQLNHPLFSRLFDNEFVNLNNYDMIEIYNHKDVTYETGMANAENLIRTLLNHNKKILITATMVHLKFKPLK